MKNIRLMASTVFCASVLALSACGSDDSTDTAAPAPSATTAATAAATTGAPAASAAPAATGASDKEICEAAVATTAGFQKKMAEAMASGKTIGEADVKGAWTDLAGALSIAEGGDSAVAKAAQAYVAELNKAAAAADPTAAGEAPSFGKAGTDLDTACTAVGVSTTLS